MSFHITTTVILYLSALLFTVTSPKYISGANILRIIFFYIQRIQTSRTSEILIVWMILILNDVEFPLVFKNALGI